MLLTAEQAIRAAAGAGLDGGAALNAAMVEIGRASAAHSMLVLLRACFHPTLQPRFDAVNNGVNGRGGGGDNGVAPVMAQVRALFALYHMERDLAEFLEHGFLTKAQATLLRKQVRELLASLRPQAVALVDAWGIDDWELNSALGKRDGNVYEALMESAQKEPLNADRPFGGWQTVVAQQQQKPPQPQRPQTAGSAEVLARSRL